MSWINLTTDGITARHGHGFASADEKLYVFGGIAGNLSSHDGEETAKFVMHDYGSAHFLQKFEAA
jgi:hypothetical protein